MGIIPLHLERKFEQRWAARFVAPVASAVPTSNRLKGAPNTLSRPATAKEKSTELNRPPNKACESDVEFGNEANTWTESRSAAFRERHMGERQR